MISGVKYLIVGTGDVTTSGPMGQALKYLSTSGDVPADSVQLVAGPPAPGHGAETAATLMQRIQGGREPLSAEQQAGYEKMTGLDPKDGKPLPTASVTDQKGFVDTVAPLLGDSKRVVVYFGLPPAVFNAGLDSVAALARQYPNKKFTVILEKPFGKSLDDAQALEKKIQANPQMEVLSIDHFLAYPGNLAARQMFSQPMFREALSNQYPDRGVIRMDEGPAFVGADRPYMRNLGQDPQTRKNHGGVAEDMLQSHGWVGLGTPVLGDFLSHVQIDPASIERAQVEGFNSPKVLQDPALHPSDAATHVAVRFSIDTPEMAGVPWTMWANKGVAIEADPGAKGPPTAWFGTELHFKQLPDKLASHIGVSPETAGTLKVRVNSDPRISFQPDNGHPEILLTPEVGHVPPEATLLLEAGRSSTQDFSTPHLEDEGWKLTNQITDHFADPTAPGYVPLGTYRLNEPVANLR